MQFNGLRIILISIGNAYTIRTPINLNTNNDFAFDVGDQTTIETWIHSLGREE